MDRFIVCHEHQREQQAKDLKSNMDRFIVVAEDLSNIVDVFKIQYG